METPAFTVTFSFNLPPLDDVEDFDRWQSAVNESIAEFGDELHAFLDGHPLIAGCALRAEREAKATA